MDARIDLSSIEQPSVPPQPELPVDDAVLALEVPAASLPSEPLVTISESDISSLFENFGQPLSLPSGVESPEAAFVVEGTTPSSPAAQSDQPLDMFDILSQMTPGILDNSAEHPADVALSCDLILSPMSPEEVESLLSSEPSSPQSTPLDDSGSMDQDSSLSSEVSSADTLSELARELQKAAPAPRRKGSRSTRAAPYSKPATSREAKVVERKERKKQQNKDAALRYRQKKKAENCSALSECEQLEIRNKELHEKVDSMTREISYLKSLMAEVYKAKGLLKTKWSPYLIWHLIYFFWLAKNILLTSFISKFKIMQWPCWLYFFLSLFNAVVPCVSSIYPMYT